MYEGSNILNVLFSKKKLTIFFKERIQNYKDNFTIIDSIRRSYSHHISSSFNPKSNLAKLCDIKLVSPNT